MNDSLVARIVHGDARDQSPLQNGEIDLIITSPPYWQIKDYGASRQIGYGQSLHEYLFDLARVWAECFRVLKSGRRLCINIGDQFARSEVYGRYKVIPLHCEVVSMCQAIGFDYLGDIIWQKKTTLNPSGGAVIMGSFPHPPNGIVELDYEHILLFKKPGDSVKVPPGVKSASALSKDEWKTYFAGHWNFGGARQFDHGATFPEEMPRRLIKMFSFVGETVFDPFLGSGTTAQVALEQQRNAVGFELNSTYIPLVKEKLGPPRSGCALFQIEFITAQKPKLRDLTATYHPHVEDVPSLRDAQEPAKREAEPLWKVVEVVDERTLCLESGRHIALLGVEVEASHTEAARSYLREFVRGKWVHLRFDDLADTQEEAYIVLKNKIFVNCKMIEAGIAKAADGAYKHRDKFLNAQSSS